MKKHTQEAASELFKSKGIVLLENYNGWTIATLCLCKCGEIQPISLQTAMRGRYCVTCNQSRNPLKKPLSEKDVIIELKTLKIQYISGYVKFHTPMILICECGREFKMNLPNIRKGRRCGCKIQRGVTHHAWISDRDAYAERLKFKKLCYSLISRSLNGNAKSAKTKELLGYTSDEIQKHIKEHPEYNQCLATGDKIAIDHIFPYKAFSDYGLLNEENVWLINHLDNLRPSIRRWNSQKNASYSKEEFECFLKSKNITVANSQIIH